MGEAPKLIAWAAGQPLADLTISAPDLETLFRRYYRTEERREQREEEESAS